MKLSEAYTAQANIMLNDDLVPHRFIGPPTPEQLLEQVVDYAEKAIRGLGVGQSITIALTDDPITPWMLTWKDAPEEDDGPLGPGDQDEYLNDGDYR